MAEYKVLMRAHLKPPLHLEETDNQNTDSGKVAYLEIAQYENDPGFYLFYFAKDKVLLGDTYHQSMEEAISEAERDCDVTKQEWK